MSGSLIRTLAALALVFTASNAMAQADPYGMEYRWLTLFGQADSALPVPEGRSGLQSNVIESILGRAFFTLEADDRLISGAAAGRHFREPDPEFGLPAAFRRHRQARLSFSIRF